MKDENIAHTSPQAFARRDLIKLGAGAAVAAAIQAPPASAQETPARVAPAGAATPPAKPAVAGQRASGNGPVDETTRQLVSYAHSFSEANVDDRTLAAFNTTMIDSIAALITGMDSEPARICARMAKLAQGELKSTMFGYGIVTSPEMAAYANTSMVRHTDFNDHASDMMPGMLAIGEALHASGKDVMLAIILAYHVNEAIGAATSDYQRRGWDQGLSVGAATALGCGKLLGLNEDQLANALSLAIVPNIPLRVTRTGVLSMSKGCATAAAVRNAVFSALIAREGMTGPAQPFEGRDGLFQLVTGPFKLKLAPSPPGATLGASKGTPTEGYTQALMPVIPEMVAWTKPDDIASVHVDMSRQGAMEIAEPAKWDPRNRETADHSMPFTLAVALIDGGIWYTSFSPKRFLDDPAVRQLMQKITVSESAAMGLRQSRVTIRKKTGEVLVKDGVAWPPMTAADVQAKFDRVCAGLVGNDVRDRVRAAWSDLRTVPDIAGPIATLGAFRQS